MRFALSFRIPVARRRGRLGRALQDPGKGPRLLPDEEDAYCHKDAADWVSVQRRNMHAANPGLAISWGARDKLMKKSFLL